MRVLGAMIRAEQSQREVRAGGYHKNFSSDMGHGDMGAWVGHLGSEAGGVIMSGSRQNTYCTKGVVVTIFRDVSKQRKNHYFLHITEKSRAKSRIFV